MTKWCDPQDDHKISAEKGLELNITKIISPMLPRALAKLCVFSLVSDVVFVDLCKIY